MPSGEKYCGLFYSWRRYGVRHYRSGATGRRYELLIVLHELDIHQRSADYVAKGGVAFNNGDVKFFSEFFKGNLVLHALQKLIVFFDKNIAHI